MSDSAMWLAQSAWNGVAGDGRLGAINGEAGVVADLLDGLGMASVIARHGSMYDVASAFERQFGIELPRRPGVLRGPEFDVVWVGPEHWLAVSPNRDIAAVLQDKTGRVAAIADQSGARAVLRLSGPQVRRALAKGCPLDLDRRAFREGDAASTTIALVGVTLWRLPGDDAIHLSLFRSMASSFWSWLAQSSAEFGLQTRPTRDPL